MIFGVFGVLRITIREAGRPTRPLYWGFFSAPFDAKVAIPQVWCFSRVRTGSEKQKVAVDGLLDMLLLPVTGMHYNCGSAVSLNRYSTFSEGCFQTCVPVCTFIPGKDMVFWVIELFVRSISFSFAIFVSVCCCCSPTRSWLGAMAERWPVGMSELPSLLSGLFQDGTGDH